MKTKPLKIVMETLRVTNMLKNKHLSKAISEQGFYRFISFIEYILKMYCTIHRNSYIIYSKVFGEL